MRDRDELDFFMEHAILSKDLRDLADRARAIRARERKLAELAREYAEAVRRMQANPAALFNRGDWLRRYEEAVK